MLLIETVFVCVAVLLALVCPSLATSFFLKVEARLSPLAKRRGTAILMIALASLVFRAAALRIEPVPEPIVHDEFGYLLAADTFAHGRLTNPTPPMWEHFETFHVMFHPTYASIYPPGQGLVLYIGRLIGGRPFWGVWLSVAGMCAAITWMLQGWLSPEWAFFGGALAVLRYSVFGYWVDSYWGGAVAAIGGALLLGALPRIKKSQRSIDALVMGIGLGILANSRPYEGFVYSLPIAVALTVWLLGKNSPPFRLTISRLVAPLSVVLVLAAVATGYYLWRVTGSPVRMPYQIERETYAIAPYMIWQPVRPEPAYRHAVMRKMFVEEEMLGRKDSTSITGVVLRVYLVWSFFLGPVLTLPIVMLFFDLPRSVSLANIHSSTKFLLLLAFTFAVGSMLVNFYSPHYSAPATGLIVLLIVLSIRQLRNWNFRGLFLARSIPVICVLSLIARAGATPLHIPLSEFYEFAWYQKGPPSFGKASVNAQLQEKTGNHLVLVRYAPDHQPFREWVYNDANIDGSKVVWARDMGIEENAKLIQYFAGRTVWLLNADDTPPRLIPYSAIPESPQKSTSAGAAREQVY